MNRDPEKDVADCAIEVLNADEEVKRLKAALATATAHAAWARLQLTASSLALRSHRLTNGAPTPMFRAKGPTPASILPKRRRP